MGALKRSLQRAHSIFKTGAGQSSRVFNAVSIQEACYSEEIPRVIDPKGSCWGGLWVLIGAFRHSSEPVVSALSGQPQRRSPGVRDF